MIDLADVVLKYPEMDPMDPEEWESQNLSHWKLARKHLAEGGSIDHCVSRAYYFHALNEVLPDTSIAT